LSSLRDRLEHHQVIIYFAAVVLAVVVASLVRGTDVLEGVINPALALMLFATFLQVPLADLGRAFTRIRFLGALMVSNFVVVPLLVALLVQFLPADPMARLGVLFVLLTPCIDYVVTFSHIGRADARLLLASTPALLIAQMLLLPVYLRVFLGDAAADLVQLGPFVHAFVWLIAIPLVLAALVQLWAARSGAGQRAAAGLGLLPVPATALVLFIVVAAVVAQLPARGRHRGRLARRAALCSLCCGRAPDWLDSCPCGPAGSAGLPRRSVQLGHAQFPGRAAARPGSARCYSGAAGHHRDANDGRAGRLGDLHALGAEAW